MTSDIAEESDTLVTDREAERRTGYSRSSLFRLEKAGILAPRVRLLNGTHRAFGRREQDIADLMLRHPRTPRKARA